MRSPRPGSATSRPIPACRASPGLPGVDLQLSINAQGRLTTEEEFGDIIVKTGEDGAVTRLRDVARLELGAADYALRSLLNNDPAVGMGVFQAPGSNALDISTNVRATMAELQKNMPEGVEFRIAYDPTQFVRASIKSVIQTLLEAVALVVIVVILFLQTWRASIIPLLAVPVSVVGTFAVLHLLGFSINALSLFGLVLAIGIVVDDAIVVVENVERIMAEEGLPPLQATRKAMGQITGAVVGMSVVLVVVFVPLAFFSGSTGNIYRQFSVTMAASIAFSAFLALSLTPALCGTLLKPIAEGHHDKKGFFGWFNRVFKSTTHGYESFLSGLLRRSGRMMVVYALLVGTVALVYTRLPTSFLPNEDQGYVLANIQLPAGASQERTWEALGQVQDFMSQQPEVRDIVTVAGFSFSGQGQNAGIAFITLKDWSERTGADQSAQALANRAMGALSGFRDAFIFTLSPPPIRELGTASGFTFRLQDRGSKGHDALLAARNQVLGMAAQSKALAAVRPDGMEDAPQMQIDIDRSKADALGVSYDRISNALGTAMGSAYVNDFPNAGRLQRVVVQADAAARMQPEAVLDIPVLNDKGQVIPLSTFASTRWITGAMQTVRYNGYPAMKIAGDAAPGYSTGDAMAEMERIAAQLPEGFGFEWTGQSREEKLAGGQAMVLYAFSLLAVFLCLAALYESWSIPFSVMLVVPLGVLGVVLAVLLRDMANDVYFQIGLVTIIGLSAKNAILIVEFAKDLQAQGKSLLEAALEAAHLRFRPIIMTSLAFTLGVVPLFVASGASSASQRAIGTGVVGGMITGTALAVIFVPVFFVLVRSFFKGSARQQEHDAQQALQHRGED